MKKILLISNGGREHAIAEALKRSPQEVSLICYGSAINPGIRALSDEYSVGDVEDIEGIVSVARKHGVDFAVVGPEAPIAAGVTDALLEIGVPAVAPLKTLARLESSKGFTRELMEKHGITGNPKYRLFYGTEGLREFVSGMNGEFVVKYDGLKGGKGVFVSGDHFSGEEEGLKLAEKALSETGRVVVEEKLIGQEFSLMTLTDGVFCVDLPVVQDHKRAFVGDKGPNTGGMGSYSDSDHLLPFLKTEEVDTAREITRDVCRALLKETGAYFKGVMYGGFIATANGVRLVEYNARFGDPEVMNVLPLLKGDFVEICQAIIDGNLGEVPVEFENRATVCKYIVPEGYPDNPVKGEKIEVGEVPEGVKIYYAAVDQKNGELIMTGSRTVAVVGIAETITEAEKLAEEGAKSVKGPVFHRKDIGTAELIEKRVRMMEGLRR